MEEKLPIIDVVDELNKKLSEHAIVILQAPPGAGKSTYLPLQFLSQNWLAGKKVVMLEPRRLAARSVALRMSQLLKEEIAKTVGYRIRFENKVSAHTRIDVLTEGILTRLIQNDSTLEDIGLVIFDEFHERSLHADLALALCLQVQQVLRPDLKILIMSATLDGDKLSAQLNNAPIVTSEGRQFPIETIYVGFDHSTPLYLQVQRVIKRALVEQEGDVLVFLPSSGDIHRVIEQLEQDNLQAILCPLYGDLPFEKQQEAILPDKHGYRKVVLATSIAETSLTIEGVKVVIDSGFARVPRFDSGTGLTKLQTIKVTKDSADQRRGRAGRLGPGVCYRLWSEGANHQLNAHRVPEIMESDLASVMLELAQWGIKDINEVKWITPPPISAINQAQELLHNLQALEKKSITEKGKKMLRLPTHPRIAHMLLEAEEEAILYIGCDVAAMLEERDPLGKEHGCDLSLRVEVLNKWRNGEKVIADRRVLEKVERLSKTWRRIFKVDLQNKAVSHYDIGRLIAYAYPERIAKKVSLHGLQYRMANGRVASITKGDHLQNEEWLAIAHLDSGIHEGKIFVASPLSVNDIEHLATTERVLSWDERRGELISAEDTKIGSITIRSKPVFEISEDLRNKLLCEVVKREGLGILNMNESTQQLRARLMSIAKWNSGQHWPDVSETNLLNDIENWLPQFLGTVKKREDFKKIDVHAVLASRLTWDQNKLLDQLAPTALKVPSGSDIKLEYFEDARPPELSVRLQELFGQLETPRINNGKIVVTIHLLSPAYRPVQVTKDLQSFWATTYQEVRKELRLRYPKHSWPEDPYTAQAIRGALKRKTK